MNVYCYCIVNRTLCLLLKIFKEMRLTLSKRYISSTISLEALKDKCKGCLLGALIGDCFGKPYKLSDEISKSQLQNYFDKLDGVYFQAPFKPYSANIALSVCLGESLLSKKSFVAEDVAKRFVKRFYDDPYRDYGANISKVCVQLRAIKCREPFKPAMEQYDRVGSFGNAAAARISPVPIFYLNNVDLMEDVAIKSSEITHSNVLASYGALLQAWAIRLALSLDNSHEVDCKSYLDELILKVERFPADDLDKEDALKYSKQLVTVKTLLEAEDISEEAVVNFLGHGRIALYSVPTAIYSFLRAQRTIPNVKTLNGFRRTIQYAVLLGGDTVAISGMAGALAGAFYGSKNISDSLKRHCEDSSLVENFAEKLSIIH